LIFPFLFGLIVGSFLNCVIFRLEKKESFIKGRSYCPHCHHSLGFFDLIPVLSFLILKGRCRYCHHPISLCYPLVELGCGFLFLFAFQNQLANLELGFLNLFSFFLVLAIFCFLIIIFVFDLWHYLILDKIIYPALGLVILYRLVEILKFKSWNLGMEYLFSGLATATFFLILVVFSSGRWMGMGDVKLSFLMGLFLGFPKILVALIFSFFSGALVGTFLIILGKKTLKSEVPFGPFLVLATFISFFFSQKLIDFYLNLIF